MNDIINHPDHYKTSKGLETIDVIEAFTADLQGGEATNTGNILKYMCRWSKKNGLEDLKKAQWYLNRLIDSVAKRTNREPENNTVSDDWNAVIASLDDGSYKTKYTIGNTLTLDLWSEGMIRMRLVGIDTDDLADGSGKAKMSWIADDLLLHTHSMMEVCVNRGVDWEKSEMRTYLNDAIKPLIPETVRNRIASVTKTQPAYDTSGSTLTQTTQDEVWIPSYDEIFPFSGLYHDAFPDNASRIKRKSGSTSTPFWWLRSAYGTGIFRCVRSNGDWYASSAYISFGVALGFCLN